MNGEWSSARATHSLMSPALILVLEVHSQSRRVFVEHYASEENVRSDPEGREQDGREIKALGHEV